MTLIVCPLQFEAATIRRALRRRRGNQSAFASATILCCGPGAAGIERFASTTHAEADSVVILAGLAGALHERIGAGAGHSIHRVVNERGESWTPPLLPFSNGGDECVPITITSSHTTVASAVDRRELAQRRGAHMVDLESVAFAHVATARRWRWGIVRGVSDDLTTGLPPGIDGWVNGDGRTRKIAVLAALLRHPRLLRDARCLHHNSTRALDAAADLLKVLMRENTIVNDDW